MSILLNVLNQLKDLYSFYMALLVVAIGLFTLLIDVKSLDEKKLKKDIKIAKSIGLIYIIGGPAIYVVIQFV